jgi:hypothetical protein
VKPGNLLTWNHWPKHGPSNLPLRPFTYLQYGVTCAWNNIYILFPWPCWVNDLPLSKVWFSIADFRFGIDQNAAQQLSNHSNWRTAW